MTLNMRVLLVEDNPGDILLFERTIEVKTGKFHGESFTVFIAHSIAEAEDLIIKNGAEVILLDLYLADSQELQGLQYLSKRFPEVAIIIYSGHYDLELAERAFSFGAQDFVEKGILSREHLFQRLFHARKRHKLVMQMRNIKSELGIANG